MSHEEPLYPFLCTQCGRLMGYSETDFQDFDERTEFIYRTACIKVTLKVVDK